MEETNSLSWIHRFYPYIDKIETDTFVLKNFSLLISKLNEFIKKFDFDLLNQEIDEIKELLDLATWKESDLRRTEGYVWSIITDEPAIEEIKDNLSKWLDHLEQIWLKAKTLNEVTTTQIKNFLQLKIPSLSDWEEVKKDELNQIEDCNEWKIIENKEQQTKVKEKNILSNEKKKELKAQLENHGKAGIFEICFAEHDETFVGEDHDVLSAVSDFFDFVLPTNYDDTEEITSTFLLRYKKDLKKIKNFARNCSSTPMVDIAIDTNYIFKNEEIWKNTLIQWKANLDTFS